MTTAFFIFAYGDLLSQWLSAKRQHRALKFCFNPRRCLNQAFYGALYVSPLLHNWYKFMAKLFPGSSTATVFKKILMDQIFASNFLISSFFLIVPLLNGGVWSDGLDRIKNDQIRVLMMNYRVWPFFNFVNFSYVPYQFNVPFSNLMGMLWNAYMSTVLNAPSQLPYEGI